MIRSDRIIPSNCLSSMEFICRIDCDNSPCPAHIVVVSLRLFVINGTVFIRLIEYWDWNIGINRTTECSHLND